MQKPVNLRSCLSWLWDKAWPWLAVTAFFAYVGLASTEWI